MQNYTTHKINSTFYTKRGFFLMYMPFGVPYNKIAADAKAEGFTLEDDNILEKATSFGFGWIGVAVSGIPESFVGSNLITIDGEFRGLEHVGAYKELSKAYKSIMTDFPNAREFYSVYLNNPNVVGKENVKTLILFR